MVVSLSFSRCLKVPFGIRRKYGVVRPRTVVMSFEKEGPSRVSVAIVGGGLGGLALAIGLLEKGIDAHVFEAAKELRTDSGTVISVARNGRKASELLFKLIKFCIKASSKLFSFLLRDIQP